MLYISGMQRVARIGGGFALITAGTAMLFLPGPGLLTIAGGLALLSKDVEWAGRASDWFKERARRLATPSRDRETG
jgi:hypothetical protein